MTYIALLRGINVGGNKKVEMSKLKKVFEVLDFQNISTYINSGNVIFDRAKTNQSTLVSKIEEGIAKILDFQFQSLSEPQKTFRT